MLCGMESLDVSIEGKDNPDNIELMANYEGNDAVLFIERLRNPNIKKQLINLFQNAYEARDATGRLVSEVVVDEITTKPVKDTNGKMMIKKSIFIPITREEIEKNIDAKLDEVEKITKITFSGQEPGQNTVDLNWRLPNSEKPTVKQLSIIEAHEKGHVVRDFPHFGRIDPIAEYFAKGFDSSAILYREEDYKQELPMLGDVTYEKAKEDLFMYLFSSEELAERMSQLKNYFGMKGEELFTKEHLHYAKEHYVQDTGMNNRMNFFFQAITPGKEDDFIYIINTSGI